MSFEDALTRLRGALVPDGYEPYPKSARKSSGQAKVTGNYLPILTQSGGAENTESGFHYILVCARSGSVNW